MKTKIHMRPIRTYNSEDDELMSIEQQKRLVGAVSDFRILNADLKFHKEKLEKENSALKTELETLKNSQEEIIQKSLESLQKQIEEMKVKYKEILERNSMLGKELNGKEVDLTKALNEQQKIEEKGSSFLKKWHLGNKERYQNKSFLDLLDVSEDLCERGFSPKIVLTEEDLDGLEQKRVIQIPQLQSISQTEIAENQPSQPKELFPDDYVKSYECRCSRQKRWGSNYCDACRKILNREVDRLRKAENITSPEAWKIIWKNITKIMENEWKNKRK